MITEFALRNGLPKKGSLSPYNGGYKIIMQQMRDVLEEYPDFPIAYYLDMQDDYNADNNISHPDYKQCDEDDADINDSLSDSTTFNAAWDYANGTTYEVGKECHYPRRLEEIPRNFIVRYLATVISNLKRHENTGVAQYCAEHPKSHWVDGYEDSVGVDETELLAIHTGDVEDEEAVESAKKQLSYAIRRLHDLGKLQGIHVLSGIIAFEIASRGRTSVPNTHIMGVANHPIYEVSKGGELCGILTIENQRKASVQWLFDWLRKAPGLKYSEYQEDRKLFLSSLSTLGIAPEDVDCTQFTNDFVMNKLTVTYLSSNKVFFGRRAFNMEVYNALRSIKLDDCFTATTSHKSLTIADAVENTCNLFIQSYQYATATDFSMLDTATKNSIRAAISTVLDAYGRMCTKYVPRRPVPKIVLKDRFYKTFLCDSNGQPALFDVKPLMSDEVFDSSYNGYALLSIRGVFVALSNNSSFLQLEMHEAKEYMQNYITGNTEANVSGHKYGRWS